MSSGGHVYIMTDHMRRVLYIGVTADLPARVYQHQQGQSGFTNRHSTREKSQTLGASVEGGIDR